MSFDPYRKWLGIPDNRRPPNYYELLGITAGEKDADVIRSAIDQRRMYIRSKKGEGQDGHVKAILGLIEEATSTLLVSEFKHGYDRQLGLHLKTKGSRRSYVLPSWMESRVVRVYGEGSGIVGDLFGIVTILLAAFGLMAWWSFTLQKQEITGNEANEMTWMEKTVLGDAPKQNDIPFEASGDLPSPSKPTEREATATSPVSELEQQLSEQNAIPVEITIALISPPMLPEDVVSTTTPVFEQEKWLTTVSMLKAELQIDEIRKKLIELNPGFDGKLVTKVVDGKVSELSFITDHVSDINPLRALRHLKSLSLRGSDGDWGKSKGFGKLTNLSALKDMQITSLELAFNDITDISPLAGMPLVRLDIGMSKQVDSLLPLKGLRLNVLLCGATSVSDLSPLKGMPITVLDLNSTLVSDFSLLKDFPLNYLDLRGTAIEDLSPLSRKRLESLWCGNTNIRSIEPLRGMPITFLDLSNTKVRDLTPIESLRLKTLYLDQSPVTDLTPLSTVKLECLSLSPKRIEAGIDVVRGMKSIKNISNNWFLKETPDKFWMRFDAGEFGD